MDKGVLVVISGFSGAGKGTLMKQLVSRYDQYALSISATTRQPREGEVDGREYFFRTKEEFEEMIAQDALVEYAQYVEHYYGTPKKYVEENLEAGKDVLLEIEIQGALKIREKYPEAILIFVTPPSGRSFAAVSWDVARRPWRSSKSAFGEPCRSRRASRPTTIYW